MSTRMNFQLAIAIGHQPINVQIEGPGSAAIVRVFIPFGSSRLFDFNDPRVIWPIAKRYGCFPSKHPRKTGKWRAYRDGAMYSGAGKTPEEAVAAAVIAMHLGGEL